MNPAASSLPPARRMGITLRTALLAWLIALITLSVFVLSILPRQKETFLDNLRSKAYGVTVSLSEVAAGAVVNEDYSSVVDHCMEMIKRDPALDYIVITRNDGFSLVHDRTGWDTKTLSREWAPRNRTPDSGIRTVGLFNRRTFAYDQPFDYSGIQWGWIHVGLKLDAYDQSIADLYRRTALLGAFCLVFSFVISLVYARHLVGPIVKLQGVVQRVAAGDLSARASVDQSDEIGELAKSVNMMTDALLRRDRTLQEANLRLEDRVQERTRELREEITARERAHDQLVDTQRQLLEASRLAGMAQVATGVLHNVGNVLNSVNISANLLRNELAANPNVGLLKQSADLMRAQGPDLARFLTEDPRGRLLPSLIMEIAQELTASGKGMHREFEQLSQNIDHIKQIVAVQQSYAKAGGVHQTFDPVELFADVLRIVQASVQRHGVEVTTDYPPARPPLTTDRHLALQILVNLVQNAVDAVKPRPAGHRRIWFRCVEREGRMRLIVEDNGIGIESADRNRIFQHGFTTRKDGHGFGLHSGALAARNLGGTLEVASPGRNQGAVFTLDLPLTPVTSP